MGIYKGAMGYQTMGLASAPNDGSVQILGPNGEIQPGCSVPNISDEELLEMFREMKLARRFDERAISLQRQGRMGTYTPMSGQEGAQIGSVHALDAEDWYIPSYREHGGKMARGVDPRDILLYWMGNEIGNSPPPEVNVFSDTITVGGHPPHATGMAWAAKLRGDDCAFLCNFGDGATSQGDFHEGLNFAGVFDVPVIFFCNNNQWAISVPTERQTASETFAQKAHAYGFEGIRVDGMDPLAVYKVTCDAKRKAKQPGDGELRPTLIEAVTYRFGPHTTADDPSVYRDDTEVQEWKQKDPITRFDKYLRDQGILDEETEEALQNEVEEIIATAIDEAEAYEHDPESMFQHVYSEQTDRLDQQLEYLSELRDNSTM